MKSRYFILFLIIYLVYTNKSLAYTNQNSIIDYPAINSTSFLYPAKRLWEKAFNFVLFSQKNKVDHSQELLKERLAELKYVAEKRLLSDVETSSKRFAYQAGVHFAELKKLSDKNTINKTIGDFKLYNKTLTRLRDLYEANSSYWLLIQQDVDTINIVSDKIKKN